MKALIQCLAVGAGGFVGAIARMGVAMAIGRWFPGRFPLGTLVVNLSGCFLLGWFLMISGDRLPISDTMKLAIATGFVGAYTTFSTFIFESNHLIDEGAWLEAMANVLLSLLLGLVAVRLGIVLARKM
jgi:CrcB protein